VTPKKIHAYRALLRKAKVDELRAGAALAKAVSEVTARQRDVDAVEAARMAIADANEHCVARGKSLDLARYELLTLLDASLSKQWTTATRERNAATDRRMERAHENVLAKRYRERVDENQTLLRTQYENERAAKMREDAIEVWLESKGEGA
jgi:hypothetical protein